MDTLSSLGEARGADLELEVIPLKTNIHPGRRGGALALTLALLALVLPLSGVAFAASSPTLDISPDIQFYNQGDLVTLTATLSIPAPHEVNIDWENENGANDPESPGRGQPGSTSRGTPDDECDIAAGAISCSITYIADNTGYETMPDGEDTSDDQSGPNSDDPPDRWRAWVDQDHNLDEDLSDTTDDSDSDEPLNENEDDDAHPQNQNPLAEPCDSTAEPDCTDLVEVNIGGLEGIPDVQTVDAGSTAILTARLFGPVQQAEGLNIDMENDDGSNDPDRSESPRSPDASCTIPLGQRSCTFAYAHLGGSDNWRMWIDEDGAQSSVEADEEEGRYAGPPDCDHPEDPPGCDGFIFVPEDSEEPGVGCDFSDIPGTEDPTEPDCTDVVSIGARAGTVARIDCDDRSGNQGSANAPNDTERETNPESDPDNPMGDPSTEEYKCEAFNQAGGRMNGIQIKAEVENGVNDPDSPDGASYAPHDYTCTTAPDPNNPNPATFLRVQGICYIDVEQLEGELGTAEICFWTGTATEGAALCGDEPTEENQVASGTDAPNDLADQIEKTWADPSTFVLDCEPETDVNPAGQTHTVTCTATSAEGATVSGVEVHTEITGAGDSDDDTPEVPDETCTTGSDGTCSFTHTSSDEGPSTYRSWIEDDSNAPLPSEPDFDEGRDEGTQPGDTAEPDRTDVTEKEWGAPPEAVTMTPESDSARVGECNPFVITLTDADGAAVPNAVVDVEQRHERADNQAQNDEPTVGFCTPPESAGPNSSGVDETRGDLGGGTGSGQESPNNPGTAGGETVKETDQNGRITIGIRVAPGNGSNGAGNVALTVWWESADNDDPDSDDPSDTSAKTWTPSAGEPGVPAGANLEPTSSSDELGETQTYTVTISDANGDPVEGANLTWTEEGAGEFVSQETVTDSEGRANASVTSNETGTQTITVTAEGCAEGADCSDSSTQLWGEQEERTCPGHANDSRNQIVGTRGPDTLVGTRGRDIICGLGGGDTIRGRGGNDLLLGGGGSDTIAGGGGADRLNGGSGGDELNGGGGKDRIKGGSGNDRLNGGKGRDNLRGGTGRDRLNGGPGRDRCSGGPGRDRVRNCE